MSSPKKIDPEPDAAFFRRSMTPTQLSKALVAERRARIRAEIALAEARAEGAREEREEAARICEDVGAIDKGERFGDGYVAGECARRIRARGER